jgi:hypothetical protein
MASGADANLAPVGIPGGNIRLRARYGARPKPTPRGPAARKASHPLEVYCAHAQVFWKSC